MTSDELEAQEMRRAAAMVAELTEKLTKELQAVKPLTREQIDAMAKQAHETDPELQRMDAEIGRLEVIAAALTPGGKQHQGKKRSQDTGEKREARQVQKAQDAQEVRRPV